MSRKSLIVVAVLAVVAMLAVGPVPAQDRVTVTWFVGLGTGTNEAQIEAQEAVVEAFNASQDEIQLELNIAASYEAARDAITTLVASGGAPDIVGPVGNDGANTFAGQWLDLQPLVDSTGYDLTQFPEASVDFYRSDEGLVGLPLALFPSILYYNRDLFDEAGLNYPPQAYDESYVMPDGSEVEWNYDTVAEISKMLTVDANGNDATSPDFDPENIVQFGFIHQWAGDRNAGSTFGAGRLWDPETGEVSIPDGWRDSWTWIYNGIWNDSFYPNSAYEGSELLQGGGGAFSSGNMAMARTHTWYTCCLGDSGVNWDWAVVPSHNGSYTSPLHADTFRVWGDTPNPEETFEVLTYLVGEASLDLLSVYGGMPARESDREAFFATLAETYPHDVNWEVATASLDYPDIPSHEAYFPNYSKGKDRVVAFWSLLTSTPDLDLEAEIATLEADMAAIVAEVAAN